MRPLLAAVLISAPLAALADEGGIHVDHVWSRAAVTLPLGWRIAPVRAGTAF